MKERRVGERGEMCERRAKEEERGETTGAVLLLPMHFVLHIRKNMKKKEKILNFFLFLIRPQFLKSPK